MARRSVIVVGAGIGGLACALDLAVRGLAVTVVEAAERPGGKLRRVVSGGRAMDAGPTVFTLRWVFEQLVADAGARLDDLLPMHPVSVLARHAWPDGGRLDLHADLDRSADAIGRLSGAADARAFRAFSERARRVHDSLREPYLCGSRPNPVSLLWRGGLAGLPGLLRISPFATLWRELSGHFADPRLRQLFGRYATYCGSSPFLAPATLMLIAHVERAGVWRIDGGMHRIAEMLAALATRHGATIRCGRAVEAIDLERGRAAGVRLAGGERLGADAVVFNGDVAALAAGRLGDAVRNAVPAVPALSEARRSLSAITWNLVARCDGDLAPAHHSVLFSPDSAAEFHALFAERRLPDEPTVYVCAQDRADGGAGIGPARDADPGADGHAGTDAFADGPTDAPAEARAAGERLLCLVNAPASGDRGALTPRELAECESRAWQTMARCGLRPMALSPPVVTTPHDFERLYPATGGALYGRATHGWRASFERPGSRCRIPGLFLAGGSVHPGPGLPMAALSGRLAAQELLRELAPRPVSTLPWRPAATPGGTSTR